MTSFFFTAFLAAAFVFFSVAPVQCMEITTRYTTISYDKDDLIRKFDRKVSLGSLSYLVRNKKNITVEDETRNKIDAVLEKAESVLDMFPRNLQFSIVLVASQSDVQNIYRQKYGRKTDFISFYAPRSKTVYLSVSDVRLGVLAHELAHVILDNYFDVPPPVKIHELLSQYVETHIED